MSSVENFVYHLTLQIQDACKRRRCTPGQLIELTKSILNEQYAKTEVINTMYIEPRSDVLGFRYGFMISFSIQLDRLHLFTIYLIQDTDTGRYALAECTQSQLLRMAAGMSTPT